jgi:hypothetical protein
LNRGLAKYGPRIQHNFRTTIEGRFQSFNVCLDVWSNRSVSEEPKIAETCGANETRIDAITAAAVIVAALRAIGVSMAETSSPPRTCQCLPPGASCRVRAAMARRLTIERVSSVLAQRLESGIKAAARNRLGRADGTAPPHD